MTFAAIAAALEAAPFDAARMRRALVAAANDLRDDLVLREAAARASGLSSEMVAFALRTSTEIVVPSALDALQARTLGMRARGPCAVVLAGNVTSAAIRALAVPLTLGVPLLAKASSRDDVVARALHAALVRADPAMGARLHVTSYEGGDAGRDAALVRACEAVHVYGSDATVAAFRAIDAAKVHAHGHGLGVGIVRADARLEPAAEAFALDVAAYDQRGCLSPHAIVVVGDDARRRAFAVALAAALARVAIALPIGARTEGDLVERAAARAHAIMAGDVFESEGGIVACTDALRGSPLGRFVFVVAAPDERAAVDRLVEVAPALTCVGLAGEGEGLVEAARARLPRAALVRAGTMQTPPLDADVDGRPCYEGFLVKEPGQG